MFLWILPILLVLCYLYIRRKYSYWSDRGISGPRPIFPFGYTLSRARSTPHSLELGWQSKYGQVYGLYSGLLPTLTITDAELIKEVLVKNFHLYMNHRALNSYHELWNNNLFFIESDNWKRIRSITSPAFSTGKLRSMIPLISECIQRLDGYLEKTVISGDGHIVTKEVMAGFTIDGIASTVFATQTSANDDRSKPSLFVTHGQNFQYVNPAKFMAAVSLPRPLLNFFGITTWLADESFQFFIDLTSSVIKQRQANPGAKRADLIQLMMDSFTLENDVNGNYEKLEASMEPEDDVTKANGTLPQKTPKGKQQMSNTELIAQAVFFFIAGFETVASCLTSSLFELAHHHAIQERLVAELESCDESEGDLEAYYDQILNHSPYLDAVIKEALRKYPPLIRLERRVGFDGLTLGGVPLDKGVLIEIPVLAVHWNPKYYPNPEVYNPDRFLPENKHLLVPYAYLPFGQGPRNCIGMRFAYQEVKLCLATILKKYRFEASERTPKQMTFRKGQLMMNCAPFELKVSKR